MLKAALIGTGRIARQHLACLRQLPQADLASVCDLSPASAEAAAERYGIPTWFTDHRRMLEEVAPDVVHVTTPPQSHLALASDALRAGAHVVVEKPLAMEYEGVLGLVRAAEDANRALLENYNYLFNRPVHELLQLVSDGESGTVHHVDISLCLPLGAPGNAFADPNLRHPALSLAGGAIGDFLPHIASLAHAFVGPHQAVSASWARRDPSSPLPYDEFRALIVTSGATATLCVSTHAQPDAFSVQVYAERLRATASLFDSSLTVERVRPVPKPLLPVLNGLHKAREAKRAAVSGLVGKVRGGPGTYEGLWELVASTYRALDSGRPPPVSLQQVIDVNRLVCDLTDDRNRL